MAEKQVDENNVNLRKDDGEIAVSENKDGEFKKAVANKKNRNKNKLVVRTVAGITVLVLGAVGITWAAKSGKGTEEITTTYNVDKVSKGSISTSVSGSGKLTSEETTTVTMSGSGTVLTVNKSVGDMVSAGETIATIKSSTVSAALEDLYSDLTSLNSTINSTSKTASSKYIKSTVSGKVKALKVETGSEVETVVGENGYLCLISTDGKMKVILSTSELKKNEDVKVTIGDSTISGQVTKISGDSATIEIGTNKYEVGEEAKVTKEDGAEVGTSTLELCDYVKVTGTEGTIASILKTENASVYSGTNLFKLESYPESDAYTSLIKQKEEIEEQIADLQRQLTVSADFSGIITSLPITAGSTVNEKDTVAVISSGEGYYITLTVDESDISALKVGQKATVTLDAVPGTFEGEVSELSYEGATDLAVTSYTVTVATGSIDGAISGMSASCVITTSTSGDTLIVPVEAVQTQRGESYVYLARSSDTEGDEIDDKNIDTNSLTKVTVETGMSDGINIGITGNIEEGTIILVPVVTSTKTPSDSEESQNTRGMGGFNMDGAGGGMTPPSGGGQGGQGGNMQRGGQQ